MCFATALPHAVLAQSAPVQLNSPPALNLQEMMEALRQKSSEGSAIRPPAGQAQGIAPPTIAAPARPQGPALPSTLPSTLAPPPAEQRPAPAAQRPAPQPVDLPSSLTPFEEPPAKPPAQAQTQAPGQQAPNQGMAIPQLPEGGRDVNSIIEQAIRMQQNADEMAGGSDLEKLAALFAGDLGMNATAPTLRAQALAVSFIDYLYRRDQPRLRLLVGLPFYADDFMVDNERDLNKMLGPINPVTGPPLPVADDRKDDRLIGITTMRIAELRESEFYIGDRGADLLGLDEEDFYIHLVFLRGELIKPMIVYVRRAAEDRFEVAGFFD
ncbi:MAG: hypothetical protein CBB62_10650 [Micavibrio sp. TMED2]|nr:hypothetical protein [Alphaproteobacteria bacterium]MAS47813.1 hypothetical protein [Alphaproteobacteria bacterium]MAX96975.1 hypothetical protein [Alphaproteobacteria bacterium]OUT40237.1 MAG: hypothetical protein CBB62_10650 [Micavibrio sp. TMED2]|tara:strand:+ start:5409 stop:6383 length:975 start_codon:yes stop_codon:yes gene_type:complete